MARSRHTRAPCWSSDNDARVSSGSRESLRGDCRTPRPDRGANSYCSRIHCLSRSRATFGRRSSYSRRTGAAHGTPGWSARRTREDDEEAGRRGRHRGQMNRPTARARSPYMRFERELPYRSSGNRRGPTTSTYTLARFCPPIRGPLCQPKDCILHRMHHLPRRPVRGITS